MSINKLVFGLFEDSKELHINCDHGVSGIQSAKITFHLFTVLTSHPKGTPPELLRTVARRRPIIGKFLLDRQRNRSAYIGLIVVLTGPIRFKHPADFFSDRRSLSLDLVCFLRRRALAIRASTHRSGVQRSCSGSFGGNAMVAQAQPRKTIGDCSASQQLAAQFGQRSVLW